MYIGIDVGGTFTDAVLVENGRLLAWNKVHTTKNNLLKGILNALDGILDKVERKKLKRLTISSTVVTNQVIENKEELTDLYVIPGPGMNVNDKFPVSPYVISGYTDHRGSITKYFNEKNIPKGTARKAAVSAKFSVRNPGEERRLSKYLQDNGYETISCGAELSGNLNFVRRTNSAYFNSAVHDGFSGFKKSVEQVLAERNLEIPVYILKADGGALPLGEMSKRAVESIFTGPAASVLGMMALQHIPEKNVIALDIGGTTTDLSLWRNGQAIMSRTGVSIKEYPTAVRAFHVKSIGIGGDSFVCKMPNGNIRVGPQRLGPAMALGGNVPTLGDALIVLGLADYGEKKLAFHAMELLDMGDNLREVAQQVVNHAILVIKEHIQQAIKEENKKPVYEVCDIVNYQEFIPELLLLVGGTAPFLQSNLEKALHIKAIVPTAAAVANAVGAAVAKTNMEINVRVDTHAHTLVIPELGIMENQCLLTSMEEVKKLAREYLEEMVKDKIIDEKLEFEIIMEEEFPVVHDWSKNSSLFTVRMQLKSGVRYYVR